MIFCAGDDVCCTQMNEKTAYYRKAYALEMLDINFH
jgi:hypothetical protein